MIHAILFDFTGTLVDSTDGFRAAEKAVQPQLFKDLGIGPHETFMAEYRRLRREFQASAANFSRPKMWAELYHCFNRQADDKMFDRLERDYWNTVRDSTVMFPEALDVLTQLKRDYRIALVTNKQGPGISEDHSLSRFTELEELLPVIVIAGESPVPAKPEAAPFHLALKCVDTPADQALFVGDDYHVDIQGARNAGLTPLWLKHHTVDRNWPDVTDPAPVIDRLDLLLDVDAVLQSDVRKDGKME